MSFNYMSPAARVQWLKAHKAKHSMWNRLCHQAATTVRNARRLVEEVKTRSVLTT